MTLDARNLRILVLVCWAGFFAWLWITGETLRYLGPRTQWLVPFGALALGVAALAYAKSTASARNRPSAGETLGLAALLVPIVLGMLLVNTQLGALAASKKLTARGIDPSALAELASRDVTQLSFLEVNVAGHNTTVRPRERHCAGSPGATPGIRPACPDARGRDVRAGALLHHLLRRRRPPSGRHRRARRPGCPRPGERTIGYRSRESSSEATASFA